MPDDTDREQLSKELLDITARFKKVFPLSEECLKEISDITPLSKEHEDYFLPVSTIISEVEEDLKFKPRTGADLIKIRGEVNRIKVSFSICLSIPCKKNLINHL